MLVLIETHTIRHAHGGMSGLKVLVALQSLICCACAAPGMNKARMLQVPLPDLARSAYDVLAQIPHDFRRSIGDDKAEMEEQLSSWCGSLAAAANAGESSQKRRKRKLQEVGRKHARKHT